MACGSPSDLLGARPWHGHKAGGPTATSVGPAGPKACLYQLDPHRKNVVEVTETVTGFAQGCPAGYAEVVETGAAHDVAAAPIAAPVAAAATPAPASQAG
jgi:hypothetical protein